MAAAATRISRRSVNNWFVEPTGGFGLSFEVLAPRQIPTRATRPCRPEWFQYDGHRSLAALANFGSLI
jgi:hypothetical protein